MKLVTYYHGREKRLGVLNDNKVIDVFEGFGQIAKVSNTMDEFISFDKKDREDLLQSISFYLNKKDFIAKDSYSQDDVVFGPPIPNPPKLLCMAGNYATHIREFDKLAGNFSKKQNYPLIFLKSPTNTIIGHNQPIRITKDAAKIDWEAELAVVIGKKGKHIPSRLAYDYVLGYTIINDVSDREFQINEERNTVDFFRAKCLDTFAPMGPYLVTKEEIEDPHNLNIKLRVNGVTKQDSNTKYMVFSIPEIVEFISSIMTLEPGDVIATGTPEGIGATSGEYLKPGDVIETEVEKIGILRNKVVVE